MSVTKQHSYVIDEDFTVDVVEDDVESDTEGELPVSKNPSNLICSFCGFQASSETGCTLHRISCSGSNKLSCPLCDYKTASYSLEIHIKTCHMKNLIYLCSKCSYTSNVYRLMKEHINTTHVKKEVIKCDLCPYVANSALSYCFHRNKKHFAKCGLCKSKCKHKAVSTGEVQKHISTEEVKKHVSTEGVKKHISSEEVKIYISADDVKEYISEKVEEHPKIHVHKCSACDYQTTKLAEFIKHRSSHLGGLQSDKIKVEDSSL